MTEHEDPSNPRVALVTGGGRGIGRAIALGLAADGFDIAVNYRQDDASAAATVAEIETLGRRSAAFAGSVDVVADCERVARDALDVFGAVDVLVNCAGIASRGRSVVSTDPSEMERVWRTHVLGAFMMSKLLIPGMRARPRGDIIMISSAATTFTPRNSAPYNVAKAGLEALAHGLAKEERRNDIHVNIVAPGVVTTEMGSRLVKGALGVDDIHDLDESSPFGHVCTPEEVADVVRWVVSDGARYVNDQRIAVDGGTFT